MATPSAAAANAYASLARLGDTGGLGAGGLAKSVGEVSGGIEPAAEQSRYCTGRLQRLHHRCDRGGFDPVGDEDGHFACGNAPITRQRRQR